MNTEAQLRAFVKWNGGPSLWFGGEKPGIRLEKVFKDEFALSQNQKESIDLLMTGVMERYSSTTYSANPIELYGGEIEKLLKILKINKKGLMSKIVLTVL